MPAAHTDGDTIVQFRESDVLAVGDVINMNGYPVIDVDKAAARSRAWSSARTGSSTMCRRRAHDGRRHDHRAGHGRLIDSADAAYYRDMVTIMRDRVRSRARSGMTLPQIKAAKLDARLRRPLRARTRQWTPAHVHRGDLTQTLDPKDVKRTSPCAGFCHCRARSPLRSLGLSAARAGRGQARRRRPRRPAGPRQRRAAAFDITGYWCRSSPTTGATAC